MTLYHSCFSLAPIPDGWQLAVTATAGKIVGLHAAGILDHPTS